MVVQVLIIAFAWNFSFVKIFFFFILTRTLIISVSNDDLNGIEMKAPLVGRQVRLGMLLLVRRGRLLSLWLLFHFALFLLSIVILG